MPKQKWEYAFLQVDQDKVENGAWKFRAWFHGPDGKSKEIKIPDSEPNWLIILLNKLGSEGWEMISENMRGAGLGTKQEGDGTTYKIAFPKWLNFCFKRPID